MSTRPASRDRSPRAAVDPVSAGTFGERDAVRVRGDAVQGPRPASRPVQSGQDDIEPAVEPPVDRARIETHAARKRERLATGDVERVRDGTGKLDADQHAFGAVQPAHRDDARARVSASMRPAARIDPQHVVHDRDSAIDAARGGRRAGSRPRRPRRRGRSRTLPDGGSFETRSAAGAAKAIDARSTAPSEIRPTTQARAFGARPTGQ